MFTLTSRVSPIFCDVGQLGIGKEPLDRFVQRIFTCKWQIICLVK